MNEEKRTTDGGGEVKNLTDIRISTPRWTFLVTCNRDGIITFAAPVVPGFLSRPLSALLSFLRRTHKSVSVNVL